MVFVMYQLQLGPKQIIQFLCSPAQLKFQTVVYHASAEKTSLIPVWKQHTRN